MSGTANLNTRESLILINPNKSRNLRKTLCHIEQMKIASANYAFSVAKTPAQKKKAAQTKSLPERYGSSSYWMMNQPLLIVIWMKLRERIAQAAEQKQRLLGELAAKLDEVNHDHTYACFSREVEDSTFPRNDTPAGQSHGM